MTEVDPIFIVGSTYAQAKQWARGHVRAVYRAPIIVIDLTVLRGARGRLIVELPGAYIPEHIKRVNTVITPTE